MKHRLVSATVLLLMLGTGAGCDRVLAPILPPAEGARGVELHVQDGFAKDYLEVRLDGQVIFADTVTTDDRIGLSRIQPFTITRKVHRAEVRLNDLHTARLAFQTDEVVALAVRFSPYDYFSTPLDSTEWLQVYALDYAPGYD